MTDILGHLVIWAVISLFTAGIGLLFWPYAAAKLVLNSIVIDGRQIKCEIDLGKQVGHMILWAVLIVCTAFIAFPFYIFGVVRTSINVSKLA